MTTPTGEQIHATEISDRTTGNELKVNTDGSLNIGPLGSALTPWTSQPTQTAAAAADTVLKWGSGGTTPFNHLEIMNNGTVNFLYCIDADSTAGTAKVYTIAAGQHVFIDRAGSALHCNSATQITFGGSTGVTIEAFA